MLGVRRAFLMQGIIDVVRGTAFMAHKCLTPTAAPDVQVAEAPVALRADPVCFSEATLICTFHGASRPLGPAEPSPLAFDGQDVPLPAPASTGTVSSPNAAGGGLV